MMRTFAQLEEEARRRGPGTVAVAGAASATALAALDAAVRDGMAGAVLVGDVDGALAVIDGDGLEGLRDARLVPAPDDEVARRAAALAGAGEADVLLKGTLRTDQLLRAVLDPDHALRTGRLLSDVLLYEDTLSGGTRLVGITDGGINPAPDADQKRQIVANAVAVFRALGFERPRVALMSATEAVTDAVPSTVEWRALADEARAAAEAPGAAAARQSSGGADPSAAFARAEIFGPLALDNALLESAARAKGIDSPVAGHADLMVVPNIEAGNLLGKAVKYLAGSVTAHVVVGATVPVLIPSRVESALDKRMSIALGVLVHDAVRL